MMIGRLKQNCTIHSHVSFDYIARVFSLHFFFFSLLDDHIIEHTILLASMHSNLFQPAAVVSSNIQIKEPGIVYSSRLMHVFSKYFLQGSSSMSWYATFLSLLQLTPYCCADEVRWLCSTNCSLTPLLLLVQPTTTHPCRSMQHRQSLALVFCRPEMLAWARGA